MKKLNLSALLSKVGSMPIIAHLRGLISPVFLIMLVAATLLWYITKLGNSYTTELELRVFVARQPVEALCLVEGVGSNLVGYKLYKNRFDVPLAELKFTKSNDNIILDRSSLLNAISVRCSDIKIISMDVEPIIEINDRVLTELKRIK